MTALKGDLISLKPEEMTGRDRNSLPPTNRNLKILNSTGKDAEDYQAGIAKNPRMHYAAMRAHQEMAAQALAAGGTYKMASRYAGVSIRQVKKYYTDPDFRARIEELRNVLTSRIRGRLVRELNRRTTGKNLENLEILDFLRVWDRVNTGGKGMKLQVDGDVTINNYDAILQALFAPNPGSDGADFPVYGSDSVQLPGGDSPE